MDVCVRELLDSDVPKWSSFGPEQEQLRDTLARVSRGAAECLVAEIAGGRIVGKVRIDYEDRPGVGTIMQFDVVPDQRSRGVGTTLMRHAEQRVRARGLRTAEIGVETNNPRALALYERLGYTAYAVEPESWTQHHPDGTEYLYKTECTLLRKAIEVS
ncbi:MAG: GNAT family N-acetyltransferase [Mycobacteriales bacterium]